MRTIFQDLAYGWRMLRKNPGLTAVILVMLRYEWMTSRSTYDT